MNLHCATAFQMSINCLASTGIHLPYNGVPAHVATRISLFSKSHDCGQVVAHPSTCPPWAGSDSGREGRFTGTIWQRWSEGLFSLIVVHAGRSHNCAFAERNRIGGARKKWERQGARTTFRQDYFSFACSALAFFRTGTSWLDALSQDQEVLVRHFRFDRVTPHRVSTTDLKVPQ